MSAKAGIGLALVLGLLGSSVVRAQPPAPFDTAQYGQTPSTSMGPSPVAPPGPATTSSAGQPTGPTTGTENGPPHLSNWITYTRPDCCGPVGGNGPITYDIYLWTGPDFAVGSGFLARQLESGWMVEGGGRSLFYNPEQTAAWVVDLGLSFNYNHSIRSPDAFNLFGHEQSVKELHRELVRLGAGRQWYLSGSASSPDLKWVAGVDAGGRYGPARLKINDLIPADGGTHVSDVVGGAYIALYTGIECPCGCCKWEVGFRFEYDYIWQDILPQDSDVQDIMLMLTGGVRF